MGPAHVQLHEGAGQRFRLPRRGPFAGAQPDDRIVDPHRLSGLQRDVARDAVALVEQPDDRDALRHRGRSGVDRTVLAVDTHLVAGQRARGRRTACDLGQRRVRDRGVGGGHGTVTEQADTRPGHSRCRHQNQPADRERSVHASGLHAS
ncbi:hypothetical protein NS334_14265 [Sphingomonas endophytica]|uniref:Uncharacterized protein n=1 Tax=Sphingomonas endophytica TaxID=869719 RepID=A0A147HXP9_9SPHN|nr:hypothetical protein NS334_14265 [Sphingomonas endophytica]